MTAIEHAILATFVLYLFHKWGEMRGRKIQTEKVIENTFDALEENGFILTKTLPNGDKELVKVIDTTT